MKVLIIGADSALSQAIITDLNRKKIAFVATSRRLNSNHYYLDVDNTQETTFNIKKILNEHEDISHLVYTPAIS
ncbi:MAG TPA: hypothetical protein VHD33_06975, partial [Legionellaceae bacterium]|nr:hypothetical protein [Legionellaceae bacterium]